MEITVGIDYVLAQFQMLEMVYTTSNGTFLKLGCNFLSAVYIHTLTPSHPPSFPPSLLLTLLPTEPICAANNHPSVCSHLLPTTAERTWTAST